MTRDIEPRITRSGAHVLRKMHRLELELIYLQAEEGDSLYVHRQVTKTLDLALDSSEVDDLVGACSTNGPIARDLTDAELLVFAHVNSQHCRYEQSNALWIIDGVRKPYSLFDMIRGTRRRNPEYGCPKWMLESQNA